MEEEKERMTRPVVWELKIGDESKVIELWKLKKATESSFAHVSDNYKQKLIYNLLEAVKNNDQSTFSMCSLNQSINLTKILQSCGKTLMIIMMFFQRMLLQILLIPSLLE